MPPAEGRVSSIAASRLLAGVMGYEEKNLQPAYKEPIATAWFPSMKSKPIFVAQFFGVSLCNSGHFLLLQPNLRVSGFRFQGREIQELGLTVSC
jgi:hypothetical protein